jgi:hypothetical protein
VSPDLLCGRYNLNVPWTIWIVRVNGQFKIRFLLFKLRKNSSHFLINHIGWSYSDEAAILSHGGSQGGHISKFKVGLRLVKVNKGFNLIYLVIPMILTSIVFIWAKGSVPNPKTGHLYREII